MKYLALFFMLSTLFSSCDTANENSGKKIFRYNEPKSITSLDPAFARSISNIWVVNMLYNGLVQFDSNLVIKPSIASRWEISEDGKTYHFWLRKDVFFHKDKGLNAGNARLVNAKDFVFSFNRIIDPKVASPGSWVFANVDNSDGKGFQAPSDSELVIKLLKPFPPFLGILAMPYCCVVPKEAVELYGNEFRSHPIGTGPFSFFIWKDGVKLVLHKHENYFEKDNSGNRLPYIDAVSVTFTNDAQSSFMAFLQGKTDFLNGLDDGSYKDAILNRNGSLKAELQKDIYLTRSDFLNTEYLGFLVSDTAKAAKGSPVLNKDFRQAINYAIDKKKMLRYIRNGVGIAGEAGLVPPSLISSLNSNYGYTYNTEKAKELLVKCGYKTKMGSPEVKLYITSQYADLCEFIQNQLEAVGINVKIEVNPPATHAELVTKAQAPFFRKSWVADYPDAENYLSLFYSKNLTPNGPNYTLYSSAKFDQLYKESLLSNNDYGRGVLYREMDSLVMSEAPVVVLFYDESLRFIRKRVSGLGSNPMNLLDLKRVKLESEHLN